jgi:hypothetical protein
MTLLDLAQLHTGFLPRAIREGSHLVEGIAEEHDPLNITIYLEYDLTAQAGSDSIGGENPMSISWNGADASVPPGSSYGHATVSTAVRDLDGQ